MLKFFLGLIFGLVLSVSYVWWGVEKPVFLDLLDRLQGNVIASATDSELYDVNASDGVRRRAVEVYFRNSSADAAKVDAEAGHPFLTALHRHRVLREARQLRLQWTSFDKALAQPAIREGLEKKYQETDTISLKQAMLMQALQTQPFLSAWISRYTSGAKPKTLLGTLTQLSRRAPVTTTAIP